MQTFEKNPKTTEPFSPIFTPNPPQVMNPSLQPEKNLSVQLTPSNDKNKPGNISDQRRPDRKEQKSS